jgi:hypothetical protein
METQLLSKEILDILNKMQVDISLIKERLDEGELTDWAKEELSEARSRPDSKISHDEVKRMILAK